MGGTSHRARNDGYGAPSYSVEGHLGAERGWPGRAADSRAEAECDGAPTAMSGR